MPQAAELSPRMLFSEQASDQQPFIHQTFTGLRSAWQAPGRVVQPSGKVDAGAGRKGLGQMTPSSTVKAARVADLRGVRGAHEGEGNRPRRPRFTDAVTVVQDRGSRSSVLSCPEPRACSGGKVAGKKQSKQPVQRPGKQRSREPAPLHRLGKWFRFPVPPRHRRELSPGRGPELHKERP